MNRLFIPLLMAPVVMWAGAANALSKMQIPDEQALSNVSEVAVPGGHSVVLSFENNRYIQSVWIDDQSILGVATNRPLCGIQGASNGCGFATSARFTQLSGAIDLPGSSFKQGDGLATLVSVETTDVSGQQPRIYQFLMNTKGSVTSNVSMVSIVLDQEQAASPPSISSLRRSLRADYDLEKVRSGRDAAIAQGIADTSSVAWASLEQFLSLTESGTPVSDAIRQSRVSSALLTELERLGSFSRV